MDKSEMVAAKEAAKLLGDFGFDLLDNMSPQAAFHGMVSGAILFGVNQFGAAPVASWLRTLAETIEQSKPVN